MCLIKGIHNDWCSNGFFGANYTMSFLEILSQYEKIQKYECHRNRFSWSTSVMHPRPWPNIPRDAIKQKSKINIAFIFATYLASFLERKSWDQITASLTFSFYIFHWAQLTLAGCRHHGVAGPVCQVARRVRWDFWGYFARRDFRGYFARRDFRGYFARRDFWGYFARRDFRG